MQVASTEFEDHTCADTGTLTNGGAMYLESKLLPPYKMNLWNATFTNNKCMVGGAIAVGSIEELIVMGGKFRNNKVGCSIVRVSCYPWLWSAE